MGMFLPAIKKLVSEAAEKTGFSVFKKLVPKELTRTKKVWSR
jgi:hypothetical protein